MPELPEVDAIAGVIREHAIGLTISDVTVLRGKYLHDQAPFLRGRPILDVYRVGKTIVMELGTGHRGISPVTPVYLVTHNAMTGFFDWKHSPWTFDYVEGKRKSTESDIRVTIKFEDGSVLRFHDSRLFGKMELRSHLTVSGGVRAPGVIPLGPELMETPNGCHHRPTITLEEFARGIFLEKKRTIKSLLMDQHFFTGIGNIYSNEGLHLAGVDPRTISDMIYPRQVPILLDALRCCVEHSIPTVRYDWLKVYRRSSCGTCLGKILRVEIDNRATFICESCQI